MTGNLDGLGYRGATVLMTGGASGLGQAAARLLGEWGATVHIADIADPTAPHASFTRLDLSDFNGVRAACARRSGTTRPSVRERPWSRLKVARRTRGR